MTKQKIAILQEAFVDKIAEYCSIHQDTFIHKKQINMDKCTIIVNTKSKTFRLGDTLNSPDEQVLITKEEIQSRMPGVRAENVSALIIECFNRALAILRGEKTILSIEISPEVRGFLCGRINTAYDYSVRAYNCFSAEKIVYNYEVLLYSTEELLAFRNFGRKTLREVTELHAQKEITPIHAKYIKNVFEKMLTSTRCADIENLVVDERFQELSVMLSPIEDFSLRNIEDIVRGKLYRIMFPYSPAGRQERTVYETMFSNQERKTIQSLLDSSQKIIREWIQERMIGHISSL